MPTIEDLRFFFEEQNTVVASPATAAETIGLLLPQFQNFSDNIRTIFIDFYSLFNNVNKYAGSRSSPVNPEIIGQLHALDPFIFYFILRGEIELSGVFKLLARGLGNKPAADPVFEQSYNSLILGQDVASKLFRSRFSQALTEQKIIKKAGEKLKKLPLLPEELIESYATFFPDVNKVIEPKELSLDGVLTFYSLPEGLVDEKSLKGWKVKHHLSELVQSFIVYYSGLHLHMSRLDVSEKEVLDVWCQRPWLQGQQEQRRLQQEGIERRDLAKFLEKPSVQEDYIAAFMALGCLSQDDVVAKFRKDFSKEFSFNPDVLEAIPQFWDRFRACCEHFKKAELELMLEHPAFIEHKLPMFTRYCYVYKIVMPRVAVGADTTVESLLATLSVTTVVDKSIVEKKSLVDQKDLLEFFLSEEDFFRRTMSLCFLMENKDFLLQKAQQPGAVSDQPNRKLTFDSLDQGSAVDLLTVAVEEGLPAEFDSEESLQGLYDSFVVEHNLTNYILAAKTIRQDSRLKRHCVLSVIQNRHLLSPELVLFVARIDPGSVADFFRSQLLAPAAVSFWRKTPKKIFQQDPFVLQILKGDLPSLDAFKKLLEPSFHDISNVDFVGLDDSVDFTALAGLFSPNTKAKAPGRGGAPANVRVEEDIKRPEPNSVARVKNKRVFSPLSPKRV